MQKVTRVINHNIAEPWWGLRRNITPCFGARLADRASIAGTFNDADLRHLDQAFPVLMKQMELMLTSSELTPHIQRCITLHVKGLICEADTLGSCGYLYIVIYPAPATTE